MHDSGFEETSGFLEYIRRYPSDLLDTLNLDNVFHRFLRSKIETGHETDNVVTICRSIGMKESLIRHVLEAAECDIHGDLTEVIIAVSNCVRAVARNNVHGKDN
jgi:hypothetical protein